MGGKDEYRAGRDEMNDPIVFFRINQSQVKVCSIRDDYNEKRNMGGEMKAEYVSVFKTGEMKAGYVSGFQEGVAMSP